jgi:hypothetical protein
MANLGKPHQRVPYLGRVGCRDSSVSLPRRNGPRSFCPTLSHRRHRYPRGAHRQKEEEHAY